MHDYVVRALNFSSAAAFNRIAVGRKARRYPRILDMIAAGELHLSGAKVLAPVLTDENADRLLAAASRQTKRRIEEIVAAEKPRPDVPTSLVEASEVGSESLFPGRVAGALQADPAPEYAKVEVLAPERYALTVTISGEIHDKLQEPRDLNRHVVPDGDVSTILGMALDLLVEKARKRQFAETDRPRAAKDEPVDPDAAIPAHMRREISERDGYRCTFVAEDGTRCGARSWLQFDHIVAKAQGGQTTVENLRLLCGPHNRLEAERKLGAWVRDVPASCRRVRSDEAPAACAQEDRAAIRAKREPPFAAEVEAALVRLGYKAREARAAIDAVGDRLGAGAALKAVLGEALRAMSLRCREPRAVWRRGADRARPRA